MKSRASNILIKSTDTAKELFFIYITIIIVSASAYALFEHKSIFDALWWAMVTAMTIGYGDTYPVTIGGRITAIVLMHIVPLLVIPLITARLSSKLIVDSNAFTSDEQEEIKQGIREIKHLLKINNQEK